MKNHGTEHWRELMIGALYDELDTAEQAELDAALQRDATLQAEFSELQQTRTTLARLGEGADTPDSVFLFPEPTKLTPISRSARKRWLAPAAGFAAAAMLFVGLLIAGLRVDRTPEGILVRFAGEDPRNTTPAAAFENQEHFVSRAEFAAATEYLMGATMQRLDEIERRQASTQTEMARSLYGALSESQQMHFADLKHRIDMAALSSAVVNQYGRPVGTLPKEMNE
jgi:hypothetical protein